MNVKSHISLPESNAMTKLAMPPLANYRELAEYIPQYGDFVVWAGWFSTWFGVVQGFDPKHEMLEIIFGGLPILLVTMDTTEYHGNTKPVPLSKLKNDHRGVWAVIRHDHTAIVWYI